MVVYLPIGSIDNSLLKNVYLVMGIEFIIIFAVLAAIAVFGFIYSIYKINKITNDYIFVNKDTSKEVYVKYGCLVYQDDKWIDGIVFQSIPNGDWFTMSKKEFINCYTKKYGQS